MSDFVKKNKVSVILLLIFISLTLASNFYLKTISPSNRVASVAVEPEVQAKPEVISPAKTLSTNPQSSSQTVAEVTPIVKETTPATSSSVSVPVAIGESYTLIVGDRRYEINLPANQTVYNLMMALKHRGDFDFTGKGSSGLGWFVESINGVKNNSFKNIFWFYYINGQSANVGISNYILKPNDVIAWKYETSKF